MEKRIKKLNQLELVDLISETFAETLKTDNFDSKDPATWLIIKLIKLQIYRTCKERYLIYDEDEIDIEINHLMKEQE